MEYFFESREHPTVSINSRNLNFLPHLHHETEIISVVTGSIILTINGHDYHLNAGDCALIQPNMIHSYKSKENLCLLTIFDPSLVPSLQKALHDTVYMSPYCHDIGTEFFHAAHKLSELSLAKDSQTLIKGYLYVMLSLLTLRLTPCTTKLTGLDSFQKILLYVNRHFDSEITITNTAYHFGITYEHLSRVYKEKTGLTFSEHIRLLRISKAKQLLCERTAGISEIAAACGYDNERSFYRAFKLVVGTTPRQYRIQQQNITGADS